MSRTLKQKNALQGVKILIADADKYMARVLKQNLLAMGFGHVLHVADGRDAELALKARSFDILLTEWSMPNMDGIDLVGQLRHDDHSPSKTLPIIMLTGRGERSDVAMARDSGISEFVVKPFSSQTLFSRLEQLVDYPRGFVLSPNYVGPDRRRKSLGPPDGIERRKTVPVPMENGALDENFYTPRFIRPDYAIKRKIHLNEPLRNIITPEVLKKAQEAIEAMRDESLTWIKEDMAQLETAYHELAKGNMNAIKSLKEAALSIKSRAGTFGYHLTSEVARLLYRFICTSYNGAIVQHNMIVQKHIEALKVIFVGRLTSEDIAIGEELIKELEVLVQKYREMR